MNINRKIVLGAGAIVALGISLGVTGCTSNAPVSSSVSDVQAPAPVASAEQVYLESVHSAAPETIAMNDAAVVKIAKTICSSLDEGYDFGTVANMVLQAALQNDVSASAAGAMVGAGVVAFCPEYKPAMNAYLSEFN